MKVFHLPSLISGMLMSIILFFLIGANHQQNHQSDQGKHDCGPYKIVAAQPHGDYSKSQAYLLNQSNGEVYWLKNDEKKKLKLKK